MYIEEQTTQWPKEKVQKEKQRSTKHTHRIKDRPSRTPLKTGGELRCSGTVSNFCSTSGTRRVNLVKTCLRMYVLRCWNTFPNPGWNTDTYLIQKFICNLPTKCYNIFLADLFVHASASLRQWQLRHYSPDQVKPETIKLVFVSCFSAKYTTLRRKSKYLLARNQDNVSVWGDMSIRELLFK